MKNITKKQISANSEMTIMMTGPGTFTMQNWDEIVGELRKYWTWD